MISESSDRDARQDQQIAWAKEVDELCDQFEQLLLSGSRPNIEEYLGRLPAAYQSTAIGEFVGIDLELRRAAGEAIDANSYLARFPNHTEIINQELEHLDRKFSAPPADDIGSESSVFVHSDSDSPNNLNEQSSSDATLPRKIGRYDVQQLLGEGGFGRVYLAHDRRLNRLVAIKIPKSTTAALDEQLSSFVNEARIAARLNHPGLVVVYDVQHDNRLPYIVQQYIDGLNLRQWMKSEKPSEQRAIELMIDIGEAVEYLHQQGLVHRDLKPSNILIDDQGKPHVADFGLAMMGSRRWEHAGEQAGTYTYMSPEQLRGESHLLDPRSDLWSLGVILYELLTGQRPYSIGASRELVIQIHSRSPQSIIELAAGTSREIERICLKCLEPRRVDRYSSAAELVDELRQAQRSNQAEKTALDQGAYNVNNVGDGSSSHVVPKGLHSFDQHDASFYLDLLPGPFDRDGLPECIRFWKMRIERPAGQPSFRVGLMYGPSGCGKTSLMKAGILPRLPENIIPVYIEASHGDTESRLIEELKKSLSRKFSTDSLTEILQSLRLDGIEGGKRLLIVIDQFEQWLHYPDEAEERPLVSALRQCDGDQIQAILMLRDDFWMKGARLIHDLEITLSEEQNTHAVDNFSKRHAANVLAKFGRAYGTLANDPNLQSEAQTAFIEQAIASLAEDGKVICVRLALFAEMMKERSWTVANLAAMGGEKGIGFTFLEDSLGDRTSRSNYRVHTEAARAVLASLLPEPGVEVRGHRQTRMKLVEVSGYHQRPNDFEDLLRILDNELRLITPTASNQSEISYELTHDYLIPSLRQWLSSKQQGTRSGRADLRMQELASLWKMKPEKRFLPTLGEWLMILWYTPRFARTDSQKDLLRGATRFYGFWATVVASCVLVLGFVCMELIRSSAEKETRSRANSLVEKLEVADTRTVPAVIEQLEPYWTYAAPILNARLQTQDKTLNFALALLSRDASRAKLVYEKLLEAEPDNLPVIIDSLRNHQREFNDSLWSHFDEGSAATAANKMRAATMLAQFDSNNPRWPTMADQVARELVRVNPIHLGQWTPLLNPVRKWLNGPLSSIFRDRSLGEVDRNMATQILTVFAHDQPAVLVDLICHSDDKQFEVLFPLVQKNGRAAIDLLEKELTCRSAETSVAEVARLRSELLRVQLPQNTLSQIQASHPQSLASLDSKWKSRFESYGGLLNEQHAVVQSMPDAEFDSACEQLRHFGYRPTRCRPYPTIDSANGITVTSEQSSASSLVAAIWTRDQRDFRCFRNLSSEEIQERDKELRQEEFIAVDAAGWLSRISDQAVDRYCALWVKKATDDEDSRLFVGSKGKALPEKIQLETEGYFSVGIHHFLAADKRYRYCQVYRRQTVPSAVRLSQDNYMFRSAVAAEQNLHDVSMAIMEPMEFDKAHFERVLELTENELKTDAKNRDAMIERGLARFNLDQIQGAMADFNRVLELDGTYLKAHMYIAYCHASLGNKEAALAAAAMYSKHPSYSLLLEALMAFEKGELEASRRYEEELVGKEKDYIWLFNSASLNLVGMGIFADKPDIAAKFKKAAFESLQLMVDAGFEHGTMIWNDSDFEAIRKTQEFYQIMEHGHMAWSLSTVWQANDDLETAEVHGLTPEVHLVQCRTLSAQGWQPVAIAMAQGTPTTPGSYWASSVWHRPLATAQARMADSVRRAQAAVALLRQGERDKILETLRVTSDPESMTQFIHLCKARGVSAEDLWYCAGVVYANRQLLNGPPRQMEERALFGLLLALGDYAITDLPEDQRTAINTMLAQWYRYDASAAIHAASGWLLRRWGQAETVRTVDETPLGYDPNREWLNIAIPLGNKTLYQTYVVIPPGDFLLGSPTILPETNGSMSQYRLRLKQPLAILNREITRGEYEEFDITVRERPKNHRHLPSFPVCSVHWYECVDFCRWLGEKCGLTEADQAYAEPESLIKGGAVKDPTQGFGNYPLDWPLNRTSPGFRLPTVAEFEVAARAGTDAAYAHGDDVSLLKHYAWYGSFAMPKPSQELRPNAYGCFDLFGNLSEWCHDWVAGNPIDVLSVDPTGPVFGAHRVYWNADYRGTALQCRSFYRHVNMPTNRNANVGFRIAFTPTLE